MTLALWISSLEGLRSPGGRGTEQKKKGLQKVKDKYSFQEGGENMKKKWIALLLTATMVFTLAACGNKGTDAPGPTVEVQEPAETTAAEETAAEETAPAVVPMTVCVFPR